MDADVFTIVIVAAVFAAGFLVSVAVFNAPAALMGSPASGGITGAMINELPCMSTDGCVAASVTVDQDSIYLTSGCYALAIESNELQTYSISAGIKGIREQRPSTHDAILDMMDTFGVRPLIVRIESYEQGVYSAKLAMMQGNKVLEMDIRPSDAIAIAVRARTPVYVNENLMKEKGVKTC